MAALEIFIEDHDPKNPPTWLPAPREEDFVMQKSGQPCAVFTLLISRCIPLFEKNWTQIRPVALFLFSDPNAPEYKWFRKALNTRLNTINEKIMRVCPREKRKKYAVKIGSQYWFPGWYLSLMTETWSFLIEPTKRFQEAIETIFYSGKCGNETLCKGKNGYPEILKRWTKAIREGDADSILDELESQNCKNPGSIAFEILNLSRSELEILLGFFGLKVFKFCKEQKSEKDIPITRLAQTLSLIVLKQTIQTGTQKTEDSSPPLPSVLDKVRDRRLSRFIFPKSMKLLAVSVFLVGMVLGGVHFFTANEIREVAKTSPDFAAQMNANSPRALLEKLGNQIFSGENDSANQTANRIIMHPDSTEAQKANGYYYKGWVKYNQALFGEALHFYGICYEKYRLKNAAEKQICRALIEMGRCALRLKNFEECERYLNLSEQYLSEISDPRFLLWWYDIQSQIALENDNRTLLLEICLDRKRVAETMDDQISKAIAYSWTGYAMALNGRLEEAIALTSDAQSFVEEVTFERLRPYQSLNWVLIRRFQGQQPDKIISQIKNYLSDHQDFDLENLLKHATQAIP